MTSKRAGKGSDIARLFGGDVDEASHQEIVQLCQGNAGARRVLSAALSDRNLKSIVIAELRDGRVLIWRRAKIVASFNLKVLRKTLGPEQFALFVSLYDLLQNQVRIVRMTLPLAIADLGTASKRSRGPTAAKEKAAAGDAKLLADWKELLKRNPRLSDRRSARILHDRDRELGSIDWIRKKLARLKKFH